MKRLDVTAKISALLKSRIDDNIDPNSVAVFESISLNTLPLQKSGSIFEDAITLPGTLHEMAAFVQSGETIPLILMHDDSELPVGKLFHAESRRLPDGETELRSLFMVPLSEEMVLAKLDSGTVDEVSVSFKSKKLLCSECEFDFFGPTADFMNLFERTCEDGHVVGADGCHTVLDGLDIWLEQSLVGKGAADHAKIVGRSKSLLSSDEFQRLAANFDGMDPGSFVFYGTATNSNEKDNSMDLKDLVGQVGTLSASNALLDADKVTLTAEVATLTATVTELEDKLATAVAAQDTGVSEIRTELEEGTAIKDSAVGVVTDMAKRTLVALGRGEEELPEDFEALKKVLEDAQVELSALIPPGGVAEGADTGTGEEETNRMNAHLGAYTTRKGAK